MSATRTDRAVRRERDDDAPAAARSRRPLGLVLALTVLLLGGAGAAVVASPLLGLRTVVVQGSGAGDLADQVRQATGVAPGTPLIRIDLAAVQRRVQDVGPVASATVTRAWPHSLVVTVTERLPLAVTQADGRWWLLDATGKPYQHLASPPSDLTPIQLATPGQGDRATLAALAVLGSLSRPIRAQVESVVAPTAYDISLILTKGRTVIWGSTVDAATKDLVLPALLRQPGTVFDVTDPTLATVR